jgi:hypothetical protein
MSCALPPPSQPLLRQLTESKWETAEQLMAQSNVTRYIVLKREAYEYVLVRLDERVYRIIHHNGDIHVCSTY